MSKGHRLSELEAVADGFRSALRGLIAADRSLLPGAQLTRLLEVERAAEQPPPAWPKEPTVLRPDPKIVAKAAARLGENEYVVIFHGNCQTPSVPGAAHLCACGAVILDEREES